jgi:hypothetical protein
MESARDRPRGVSPRPWKFVKALAVIAATVLLGFSGYIYYLEYRDTSIAPVEPPAPPILSDLAECRHRLEVLAAEGVSYQTSTGEFPASLDQLKGILEPGTKINEPLSKQPYVIGETDSEQWAVFCPTPDEHGVQAVYAVPGKPARVLYVGEGSPSP